MRLQSSLKQIALAGAAAGIATLLCLRLVGGDARGKENVRLPVEPHIPAGTPVGVAPAERALVERAPASLALDELRARLDRLEAQPAPLATATASAAQPLDLSGQEQEARRSKDGWTRRFQQEGVDPNWAPAAAAMMREDLQTLSAQLGAEVESVQCRTTVCEIDLQWPSVGALGNAPSALAQGRYRLNCTRTVFNLPAEDPNAPYKATLFLDCEQFRAQSQ